MTKPKVCTSCGEYYRDYNYCPECGGKLVAPSIAPVENPDFTQLIRFAIEYMVTLEQEGYQLKDYEYWAYDLLMRAVYGDKVFDHINSLVE